VASTEGPHRRRAKSLRGDRETETSAWRRTWFRGALGSTACGPGSAGPLGTIKPQGDIGAPGPVVAIGYRHLHKPLICRYHGGGCQSRGACPTRTHHRLHLAFARRLLLRYVALPGPKGYLQGVDWSARHVVAGAVVQPKEQAEVVAVVSHDDQGERYCEGRNDSLLARRSAVLTCRP
jgi:hypothetical protein